MLAYLVDTGVLALSFDVNTLVVGTEVWLRNANDDFCRLRSSYGKGKMLSREICKAWKAARKGLRPQPRR